MKRRNEENRRVTEKRSVEELVGGVIDKERGKRGSGKEYR